MKIKNLFLSGLMCCTFVACSNNDEPAVDNKQNGDRYVVVNIAVPNDGGRALTENDFNDGLENESQINNALFVFFKDGTYNDSYKTATFNWLDNGNNLNPAVTKISKAIVVLDEPKVLPNQMLVILNTDLTTDDVKNSLTGVQKLVKDYSQTKNSSDKGNFVMSNSVWENNTYTKIEENNLIKVPENGVEQGDIIEDSENAVQVYVERVLAKVEVKPYNLEGDNANVGTIITQNKYDSNSNTTSYESDITLVPEITGYHLSYTTPVSYLVKDIDNCESTWGDSEAWSDANNKRSYWGNSVPKTLWGKDSDNNDYDYKLHTYTESQITDLTKESSLFYCQENTTEKATKLVVTAKLKKKNAGGELEDIDDLVKYHGIYYTIDGYKKAVANKIQEDGYTYGDNNSNDWYSQLTIKHNEQLEQWEITLGLTNTLTNIKKGTETVEQSALETIINEMTAYCWQDGKCYYFVDINHINNKPAIIRNHWYQLQVTKIEGLGTPVYDWEDDENDPTPDPDPEDEEPIDPEKPADENYYIKVQLNVIKWRMVKQQNIELN